MVFLLALLVGVPIAFMLARQSRRWERIILFFTLLLTCRIDFSIHFVSHELYRGTSRGFEITGVDLLILTLALVVLFRKEFKLIWIPPGTLLYGLYFMFSVISIINAETALYSWFEVLKMVRMYCFYWVLFNYFNSWDRIRAALTCCCLVVVYIFMVALYQKYLGGGYQISGPLPHQNSLSMYIAVLGSIFGAMVLNLKMSDAKNIFIGFIFIFCSLLELFTLSRAGMACYAGGCMMTWLFSFLNGINAKKIIITLAVMLIALLAVGYSLKTIVTRVVNAPETSRITRYNLAVSAVNMANDKFFGVGLNNFGIKVNPPYPYSVHFKHGRYPKNFKEGLVETSYLMVAAETGWLNLGFYVLWLGYFYCRNLINFFHFRRHAMRFLTIGILGGLTAIYIQSGLEWVLKQSANFYELMFVFALVAAMTRLYGWEKEQRKAVAQESVGTMPANASSAGQVV